MSNREATLRQTAEMRRNLRLLVGGELVEASDCMTFATTDPATGRSLGVVPNASPANVDGAVKAARRALPDWRNRSYAERRAVVLELGRVLRQESDLLGMLDTLDTGNVFSAMRNDARGAAELIDYYAAIGFELKGEVTMLDRNLHYTRREPYGVAVRLLPFNHPIASFGTGMAAPLLMGNTVVLKPSPHTPMSALAFGALVKDIVPPGVLNILVGSNERASLPLISHPGVDRIALTGSVEAGRTVMRAAADRLVPLTLELGGKNPLIVFPDCDPDEAADIAVRGMNYKWQSHSCASTSRVLVHKDIEQKFLAALRERIAAIKVADPFDEDAEMGAISYVELYDRCLRYLAAGRNEGASLLVGGERPSDPELANGLFLKPALFANVSPSMSLAREEIFGPITSVLAWDDRDRMVQTVNELPFGLTAVVLTNDLNAAHRTAEAVEAGYVEVNNPVSFALGSPYGGYKQSGQGREGSMDELVSYTRSKSINVRLKN